MIDPRALEQHFRKVQQIKPVLKPEIPRIPDSIPPTELQTIGVIPAEKEPVIPVPTSVLVDKIEEDIEEESPVEEEIDIEINIEPSPPSIEIPATTKQLKQNTYDPYGYYYNTET